MFRRLMALVGAANANIPDKELADLLIETAPVVIGKWTTEEVINAFTLALAGEIDAELKLYDKPFSLLYVGNVMKVYETHKREALARWNREQGQLPEAKPTEQEITALMQRHAIQSYEAHCSGKGSWNTYNSALYDWLHRIGAISFAPGRIEAAEREAERIVRTEIVQDYGIGGEMRKLLDGLNAESSRVQSKAKELLLRGFFDDMQRGGNDIRTLL